MAKHIKILGWLHVIIALFALVNAVLVFFGGVVGGLFSGSITGLVGSSFGGMFAAFVLMAFAIPGLLAGYGLLTLRRWARPLTIVLAVFELIRFPLGTILGIYSLWVLLSADGAAEFQRQTI